MTLDQLDREEQTALGGLLRLMLRSDGNFTAAEEACINAVGEELGGAARIWSVISQSAQDCPDDARIRAGVAKVRRAEARAFIVDVLERVAASDDTSDRERELLAWLRSTWT
jgi:hypothetical protein